MFKNFENNCKFYQNRAKFQDINIFKTISLSQQAIQYPYLKLLSSTEKLKKIKKILKNLKKFELFFLKIA